MTTGTGPWRPVPFFPEGSTPMIFVHRPGFNNRAIVPPLLIRIVVPLLVIVAVPLALVSFAVAFGIAAIVAAILGVRGILGASHRRSRDDKVIEAEYTVVAETPTRDRSPKHPD